MHVGNWRLEGETNREIVSFRVLRACVQSGCLVRSGLKWGQGTFCFPFFPQQVYLFPCPWPQPPIQLCCPYWYIGEFGNVWREMSEIQDQSMEKCRIAVARELLDVRGDSLTAEVLMRSSIGLSSFQFRGNSCRGMLCKSVVFWWSLSYFGPDKVLFVTVFFVEATVASIICSKSISLASVVAADGKWYVCVCVRTPRTPH